MTLSIDQQSGLIRTVLTEDLRKEVRIVIIFIDRTRDLVVGFDLDYHLPIQMNIEVGRLDMLKMARGTVAWSDVILALTTERRTDTSNYSLKIKDAHRLTPEERDHFVFIIELVNQSNGVGHS